MQKTYSLPANLALLRIYATQPDRTDIKLLAELLIRAMMQLPASDFATLLHLIPERLQVSFDLLKCYYCWSGFSVLTPIHRLHVKTSFCYLATSYDKFWARQFWFLKHGSVV